MDFFIYIRCQTNNLKKKSITLTFFAKNLTNLVFPFLFPFYTQNNKNTYGNINVY